MSTISVLDWITQHNASRPIASRKCTGLPSPTGIDSFTTTHNRWKRWSDKGIFARMLIGLAANHGGQKTVMIDATYLKAYCMASSLAVKKGDVDA